MAQNVPTVSHSIRVKATLMGHRTLPDPAFLHLGHLIFSSPSCWLFQPSWPSGCSSKSLNTRQPQNLCICSFLYSLPSSLHVANSLAHFRSFFKFILSVRPAQRIPFQNSLSPPASVFSTEHGEHTTYLLYLNCFFLLECKLTHR